MKITAQFVFVSRVGLYPKWNWFRNYIQLTLL